MVSVPTTIRAKFFVDAIKLLPTVNPTYGQVDLRPVYDENENRDWSTATPDGRIALTITNMDAVSAFEVGKHYFVDFTRTDLPAAAEPAPANAADLVTAVVPDAAPEHIGAAIEAHDAATAAGATDVQAQAIAAAIPVLTPRTPSSTDPAPAEAPAADPAAPGA